jgi:hypothetical protein
MIKMRSGSRHRGIWKAKVLPIPVGAITITSLPDSCARAASICHRHGFKPKIALTLSDISSGDSSEGSAMGHNLFE